jgi:hypothetical protein
MGPASSRRRGGDAWHERAGECAREAKGTPRRGGAPRTQPATTHQQLPGTRTLDHAVAPRGPMGPASLRRGGCGTGRPSGTPERDSGTAAARKRPPHATGDNGAATARHHYARSRRCPLRPLVLFSRRRGGCGTGRAGECAREADGAPRRGGAPRAEPASARRVALRDRVGPASRRRAGCGTGRPSGPPEGDGRTPAARRHARQTTGISAARCPPKPNGPSLAPPRRVWHRLSGRAF